MAVLSGISAFGAAEPTGTDLECLCDRLVTEGLSMCQRYWAITITVH